MQNSLSQLSFFTFSAVQHVSRLFVEHSACSVSHPSSSACFCKLVVQNRLDYAMKVTLASIPVDFVSSVGFVGYVGFVGFVGFVNLIELLHTTLVASFRRLSNVRLTLAIQFHSTPFDSIRCYRCYPCYPCYPMPSSSIQSHISGASTGMRQRNVSKHCHCFLASTWSNSQRLAWPLTQAVSVSCHSP